MGARPQTLECIKSKGKKEIDSLVLKGNALCFPSLQATQSNDSKLTDLITCD